jgi:hypothetical protein
MQINQSVIEAVAEKLSKYFELEVTYFGSSFAVHCESTKGISEFEARLTAEVFKEDGGEELDAYLDLLVDVVEARYALKPLVNEGGTWVADYGITPGDETRLYG